MFCSHLAFRVALGPRRVRSCNHACNLCGLLRLVKLRHKVNLTSGDVLLILPCSKLFWPPLPQHSVEHCPRLEDAPPGDFRFPVSVSVTILRNNRSIMNSWVESHSHSPCTTHFLPSLCFFPPPSLYPSPAVRTRRRSP